MEKTFDWSTQETGVYKLSNKNKKLCCSCWHIKRVGNSILFLRIFWASDVQKTSEFFAKHASYSHHIRLIQLQVTSGYSLNSKDFSGDIVLSRLRRYKLNWRRCWRPFRRMTIWSASKTGKNIGISVLHRIRKAMN